MFPLRIEPTELDAAFFDFDGVIVDSVEIKTKAYQEIFFPYGTSAVDEITRYHLLNGGVDRYKKIEFVLKKLGIEDAELVNHLANDFAMKVKEKVIHSEPIHNFVSLFKELSKLGKRVFVVSGTPEEELHEIVKAKNWFSYFDAVYGSPKSKIEILEVIFSKTQFPRERCLFVGDAMTDYQTALHFNIWYLGVPSLKNEKI
jgi:phosphoglycolate phosphatase-like HAD superfamily hydrolase